MNTLLAMSLRLFGVRIRTKGDLTRVLIPARWWPNVVKRVEDKLWLNGLRPVGSGDGLYIFENNGKRIEVRRRSA